MGLEQAAFKHLDSHHLQVVENNIKTIGFSRKLKQHIFG